jgi:hypothetical protein
MGDEMRVRIIIESSVYKDAYLNQTLLERGAEETNDSLAKTYAFYSDEYSNEALSDGQIERIYENEIVKITRNKSYMGIWHIFALSSVLCRNIFSVYPTLGNQNVRKDLHRLIKPREVICSETSYIMWTTTRKDMTRKNWIPNHFVTLLPIDQPTKKDENEKAVKDNDAKLEEVVEAKGITLETEKTSKERNMDAEKNDQESVKQEGNVNKDTEEIDTSATKEQTDNSEKGHKSTRNHLDISDLSPQDLLGQYVLVSYDNKPYPGIVTDCDESEVFVSCMHRVGSRLENSSFYWPLAVRDECWYDMEKVIGTIPEPTLVGQKYNVDSELWALALQKLKK